MEHLYIEFHWKIPLVFKIPNHNQNKDDNENENQKVKTLIAWRLNPKLIPMFNDLAKQAYEAHLIRQPKITSQVLAVILCRDVATAKDCPGAV
jgi:hypothetical protein